MSHCNRQHALHHQLHQAKHHLTWLEEGMSMNLAPDSDHAECRRMPRELGFFCCGPIPGILTFS